MMMTPQPNVAAWKATINVLSVVLAVRLTLLVGVSGGIALSLLALGQPDPWRVAVLGIYASVVVVPLVWLAARK